MKAKTKKQLKEELKQALELLWYADEGYSVQAKVKEFFKKVGYDFYKRNEW